MEEQPPTEAPRGPAKSTPRPRTPKATFTPSETPADQDAPARRPSAAKAAPPVLFQPPPAEERPDGQPVGPAKAALQPAVPPEPSGANEPVAEPVQGGAKRTAPKKAAAKRAGAEKAPVARGAAGNTATPAKKAAGVKKATPAKKAAPPKAAVPEKAAPASRAATPETPPATVVPARRVPEDVPAPPTARRLLAHPGFAPELLTLAAVRALAPHAHAWAEETRASYPGATPDGLARLATRRFIRLAGAGGALSATAGLLAPLAELAAVAWTQAGLVLHLAAAYGHDPAHPDRAVELLVLTQVHPDEEVARAALVAAVAAPHAGDPPLHRAAEAVWRLAAPLAAQAGGWLALRVASRLLPGAAPLAAAAGDSAAAERLAARAVARYRVRAS
ncbi:hypothetical protein [Micromonospora sp. NPDC049679]|uniref:hypothetical protein n=1 Tax=Micromonospora sp. NPDC049679 TaxID=3155920 RepID=UPI0033DC0023